MTNDSQEHLERLLKEDEGLEMVWDACITLTPEGTGIRQIDTLNVGVDAATLYPLLLDAVYEKAEYGTPLDDTDKWVRRYHVLADNPERFGAPNTMIVASSPGTPVTAGSSLTHPTARGSHSQQGDGASMRRFLGIVDPTGTLVGDLQNGVSLDEIATRIHHDMQGPAPAYSPVAPAYSPVAVNSSGATGASPHSLHGSQPSGLMGAGQPSGLMGAGTGLPPPRQNGGTGFASGMGIPPPRPSGGVNRLSAALGGGPLALGGGSNSLGGVPSSAFVFPVSGTNGGGSSRMDMIPRMTAGGFRHVRAPTPPMVPANTTASRVPTPTAMVSASTSVATVPTSTTTVAQPGPGATAFQPGPGAASTTGVSGAPSASASTVRASGSARGTAVQVSAVMPPVHAVVGQGPAPAVQAPAPAVGGVPVPAPQLGNPAMAAINRHRGPRRSHRLQQQEGRNVRRRHR